MLSALSSTFLSFSFFLLTHFSLLFSPLTASPPLHFWFPYSLLSPPLLLFPLPLLFAFLPLLFFTVPSFSFPLFSFFLTPTSPLFATFSFLLVPCSTFPASPLLRKCPHLLSSSSSLPLRFVSSSPSVHFPHYLFTYPISSLHFLLLLFLNPSISSICPHLLSSASSPCFRFSPLLLHNNRRRWLKHLCHQCRLMF